MQAPLLIIHDLTKYYQQKTGLGFHARRKMVLNRINMEAHAEEIVGIVGESGSGKTTLLRCATKLIPADEGEVIFKGVKLFEIPEKKLRSIRKEIRMIFQDPLSSLNPGMTIEETLREAGKIYLKENDLKDRSNFNEYLEMVRLSPRHLNKYPFELSSGELRRAGLARAIMGNPSLIMADEPVSGIDAPLQSDIVELFLRLQRTLKLSMLFVSHNIALVKSISDRIVVMLKGRIVEMGRNEFFSETNSRHPYTRRLIKSVNWEPESYDTSIEAGRSREMEEAFCPFYDRCKQRKESICREAGYELIEIEEGHWCSCPLEFSECSL